MLWLMRSRVPLNPDPISPVGAMEFAPNDAREEHGCQLQVQGS